MNRLFFACHKKGAFNSLSDRIWESLSAVKCDQFARINFSPLYSTEANNARHLTSIHTHISSCYSTFLQANITSLLILNRLYPINCNLLLLLPPSPISNQNVLARWFIHKSHATEYKFTWYDVTRSNVTVWCWSPSALTWGIFGWGSYYLIRFVGSIF